MLSTQSKKSFRRHVSKTWAAYVIALMSTLTIFTVSRGHVSVSAIPKGISEEYYSGGKNGTVFNTTSRCMEMPAPAVDADPELSRQFAEGESFFEADFVADSQAPFGGLGPVYVNNSCRNCHPNYGRARRVESYNEQFGNGYTTFVHTPDGKLVDGYLFMLQTKAVPPYEPPAKGVDLKWVAFVDEYHNTYPDGTPYNQGTDREGSLIYPKADLIDPLLPLPENYMVSIEATIGLYGTGLLDAIADEDIIAEYNRQQASPGPVKGQHGPWITEPYDGKKHLGKFAWHNTRATLQNGPGYNGIWNVPNITRGDRKKLFASDLWIEKQAELGLDTSKLVCEQPVELSDEDLDKLVVWFSGLAVPAARNLNDPVVQLGKEMFNKAGCVQCHKPTWTTTQSNIIPGYENQKIRPYTDLLMHNMGKANCTACHQDSEVVTDTYIVPSLDEIGPITDRLIEKRTRKNHGVKTMNHGVRPLFRTPPLWARGLMKTTVDHTDMWHDLRARSFEEAILWHYGEALNAREAFRNMTRQQRAALIKFLESI
ncbi:MAG: di-heme oxidoredictase family protein [Phycisphaeraceae bacterium JB051]